MRRLHLPTLTMALTVAMAPPVWAFHLEDVPQDHWARPAVQDLVRHGLVTGYPDGTFRGHDGLTREAFTAALLKLIQHLERRMNALETVSQP